MAGEVKARGGIKFSDGTTLDAAGGKLTLKDSAGETVSGPSAGGTGTQNRLAKWAETGGAGTLTDSAITESGGNLGVGIANPAQKLHVVASFSGTNPLTPDRIGAFVNDGTPTLNSVLAVIAGSNGVAGIDLGDTQNQNQSYVRYNNGTLGEKLRFGINNVDVLTLQSNGNVGIGTPTPIRTLQIGPSNDAAFSFSPSTGSPNAGFIRFGDNTGWKLHIGRNRESSSAPLNNATLGTLMTIQDNGNIGISTLNPRLKLDVAGDAVIDGRVGLGTPTPQAKLDVRGSIKLGNNGELFGAGGEENLRIVRGVVGFNGNIIVGSGFTVELSNETSGKHTITFNTPFAGAPAVTATVDLLCEHRLCHDGRCYCQSSHHPDIQEK